MTPQFPVNLGLGFELPPGTQEHKPEVVPICTQSGWYGKLDKVFVSKRKTGAPGGTRTPDLLVRSQTLYPTELRARSF
jgi:hypothetical protein